MLAAAGVEQDVLDIRQRVNKEPWAVGHCCVRGQGTQVQAGGSGFRKPDRITLPGRQSRINESTPVPTVRRAYGGPANG